MPSRFSAVVHASSAGLDSLLQLSLFGYLHLQHLAAVKPACNLSLRQIWPSQPEAFWCSCSCHWQPPITAPKTQQHFQLSTLREQQSRVSPILMLHWLVISHRQHKGLARCAHDQEESIIVMSCLHMVTKACRSEKTLSFCCHALL